MSRVLSEVTLGSLIELKRGYDLPKREMVFGIYPVRVSNGVLGYHNEYKVTGPGITIGRSGTVGIPHYIEENFFPHNTTLYVKDFRENNIMYIYYLLRNLKLGNKGSGSGVPTMNRNHLHPLRILACKDIEYQKKIAHVLSTLDKKIELNNRINEQLEAMAKLIYDYWFVQFDFPDENGKPYKSSGGKMVYNEVLKREIPKGWEVKKIDDIIKVKDGTHDSPKKTDSGFKLITSKHLKASGIDFENAYYISSVDFQKINQRSKVDKGDILFSMIGNIGTIYKVEEDLINFAIKNVALYKSSQSKYLKNYLYQYLKSHDMKRYMVSVKSGSIQKFISLGALRNMPFLFNEKLITDFEKRTKSIFLKMELKKRENQRLSALRDWLLPMLMNGQVTVE